MSGHRWLKGTLGSFAGSTVNHRYTPITIKAGLWVMAYDYG